MISKINYYSYESIQVTAVMIMGLWFSEILLNSYEFPMLKELYCHNVFVKLPPASSLINKNNAIITHLMLISFFHNVSIWCFYIHFVRFDSSFMIPLSLLIFTYEYFFPIVM